MKPYFINLKKRSFGAPAGIYCITSIKYTKVPIIFHTFCFGYLMTSKEYKDCEGMFMRGQRWALLKEDVDIAPKISGWRLTLLERQLDKWKEMKMVNDI